MQPSYDSWDLDPIPGLVEQGLANGGCGKGGCQDMSAYGLVDISKGKGKGYNGGTAPTDTWDTWEPAFGNGPAAMPQPTFSGSAEVPRPALPGPGMANSKGPAFDASKGKGGIWRTPSPDSYGKAGSSFAGKGGLSGKAPAGGGVFVPEPGSKGKPGFSFKGTLAPRKADFNAKGDFPNPKPASLIQPVSAAFADARATPPSSVPVPPPSFMQGKGGFGQPGVGPVRGQMPGFTSMAPQLDGTPRGPVRPPVVAPRVPAYRGDLPSGGKGVGVPPRLPLMGARGTTIRPPGNAGLGLAPQTSVTGLGTALAAAVVSRSGAGTVLRPPPPQSRFVPPARPALLGAPAQPGGTPPPPMGLAPLHSFGGQGLAANLPKLPPPLPNTPHTVLPQTSPSGLAPELAALVSAEGDNDSTGTRLGPPIPEKKPRIYLLVTRLSPELDEGHLQQIIEQCGEVQAFRRGRDSDGKPLSFGFAQFGDPEAAWKASTCLSKRVLGGQEIKVLVEEHAETLIQQWRRSQQAALRVSTDEELDWELERKAVSCKASIDAKVEELYGPPEDGSGGGAIAQRRRR